MATTLDRPHTGALPRVDAAFLAGTVPLFLAALLSDIAYAQTYEEQWIHFAAWLIAGGLLVGGIALVLMLIGLRHGDRRGGRYLLSLLVLAAAWILGLINALVHARDVWASMPAGLVLSVLVLVLAGVATWIGFSSRRAGGAP